MGKGAPVRLSLGAHPMSHRAALHPDDRMVPVLSRYGCGQTQNKSGFRAPHDLFETMSRQMMAFVHDQVTVFANEIFNNPFADETLDYCNVDPACWFAPSSTKSSNLVALDFQKCR